MGPVENVRGFQIPMKWANLFIFLFCSGIPCAEGESLSPLLRSPSYCLLYLYSIFSSIVCPGDGDNSNVCAGGASVSSGNYHHSAVQSKGSARSVPAPGAHDVNRTKRKFAENLHGGKSILWPPRLSTGEAVR